MDMRIKVSSLQDEENDNRIVTKNWTMKPTFKCFSSIKSTALIHLISPFMILSVASFYVPTGVATPSRFGEKCLKLDSKIINCSEPDARCHNSLPDTYGTCECVKPYHTLQLADPSGRYFKTECLKLRESKDSPCNNSLQCQFDDPNSVCVTEINKRTCKCREIEGWSLDADSGRCVGGAPPTESPTWFTTMLTIIGGIAFIGLPIILGSLILLYCYISKKNKKRPIPETPQPRREEHELESLPLNRAVRVAVEPVPSCSRASDQIKLSPVYEEANSQISSEQSSIVPEQQPKSTPVDEVPK